MLDRDYWGGAPEHCRLRECFWNNATIPDDCHQCEYNIYECFAEECVHEEGPWADLCSDCIHCDNNPDVDMMNIYRAGFQPWLMQYETFGNIIPPFMLNHPFFDRKEKVMYEKTKYDILERDQLEVGKLYVVVVNDCFSRVCYLLDIVDSKAAQELLDNGNINNQTRNGRLSKKNEYLVTLTFDSHNRGQVWRTLRDAELYNGDDRCGGYGQNGLAELSKKHEKYLLEFQEADEDLKILAKAVKDRLKEGFPSVMDELTEILEVEDAEVREKLKKAPRLKKILEKLDEELD